MAYFRAKKIELYPDSVFRYGIGWYFLGIFLTDTEGKLGKDLRYCTFGGNPFFARFCPLFDGPSPPFEGSSRKISQSGAPAKSYSTKKYRTYHTKYRLVWATKVALAAICLIFPALVLGYKSFNVSMYHVPVPT